MSDTTCTQYVNADGWGRECGNPAKGNNAEGEPRCGVHSDGAKARREAARREREEASRQRAERWRAERVKELTGVLVACPAVALTPYQAEKIAQFLAQKGWVR